MIAAESVAKRTQLVGIGTRNREPRALRRQRLRNGRTDTARGAGNEGSHAGEIEHLGQFLYWFTRSRGDAEGL